jgi:hypothetical protein
MITFKQVYLAPNSDKPMSTVEISVDEDSGIDEVMASFKGFLVACTYHPKSVDEWTGGDWGLCEDESKDSIQVPGYMSNDVGVKDDRTEMDGITDHAEANWSCDDMFCDICITGDKHDDDDTNCGDDCTVCNDIDCGPATKPKKAKKSNKAAKTKKVAKGPKKTKKTKKAKRGRRASKVMVIDGKSWNIEID